MRFVYQIAPAAIGVSMALMYSSDVQALSKTELNTIAKSVTVIIDNKTNPTLWGSGIIIKKSGDVYSVLTSAHVIHPQTNYEIVTYSNKKRYTVNSKNVKLFSNVDLALIEFTSKQNYSIAKIGNSAQITEGKKVYIAGFPAKSIFTYKFTEGIVNTNAEQLFNGYALGYSNRIFPGMSGGPILNEQGELIGVNGKAYTSNYVTINNLNDDIAKSGLSFGIPINTFLQLSKAIGFDLGIANDTKITTTPKAGDFYLRGMEKREQRDYQGAIADFTEAIRRHPKYASAYHDRGFTLNELGDKNAAIADYSLAIQINPKFASAYHNRGVIYSELKKYHAAIQDYTEAIRINPNYSEAYNHRGLARYHLGDYKAAIQDYNQAIQLSKKYATAYANRGLAHYYLRDRQNALADLNIAADLYRQQKKTELYQRVLEHIRIVQK